MHVAEWMFGRKAAALQQHELLEALQEIVAFARVLAPAERIGGDRVGAGRAAETEIDAARKQGFQHFESFGHHERRVVHQHDAAGAHADVRRRRCDLPDHDFRR